MIVIVFAGIFLVIVSSLASYILVQRRSESSKENREKAVQIADAGLEYTRWFLAHNPTDTQLGTGVPGPYVRDFSDPEEGVMGQYSLAIGNNTKCGSTTAIDITSTGWSNENPSFTRIVYGRYARPSVAEYAYILNSSVWAGADRVITGRYHSNGGVRMDGTNNSTVTSAVSTWQCTSSFGCSPTQTKNGVFGAGPGNTLWSYPVPQIDFTGITVNLVDMKSKAINAGGLYFGSVGGTPTNGRGYHAIFKNNGTVDVYRVTSAVGVWGFSDLSGWQQEYHIINNKTLLGNYTIPSACSVVFFEDKVWIEGVVKGKVMVVAADVTQASYDPDLVISNNITYASSTAGTDGITAIGENNVIIPLNSPNTLDVNGIFIAQKGAFGRNHYTTSGSNDVPSSYDNYVLRSAMTITGTVVSNGRVGTKWTCGGTYCSGYATRVDSYDRKLADDPPPFTPYTSSDFKFVRWLEQN